MSAGTATATSFYRGEDPLRADKLNLAFSERVARSGDNMDGFLSLIGDPTSSLHAATKHYVDNYIGSVGGYLPLSGGNVFGSLNITDPSGILSIDRNVALAGLNTDVGNRPINVHSRFTGTVLDARGPLYGHLITTDFTNANVGGLGYRSIQFNTNVYSGSVGAGFSPFQVSIAQASDASGPGGVAQQATQWAPNTPYSANVGIINRISSTQTPVTAAGTTANVAGVTHFTPFTASVDGTIGSVTVSTPTGFTGFLAAAVFMSTIGVPSGVVKSTRTVYLANPPSSVSNTLTFTTPVPVFAGIKYFLGIISNASSGTYGVEAGTTGFTCNTVAFSDFPVSAPAVTPAASVVCSLTIQTGGSHYKCMVGGTSALVGSGPVGYGSAIVDGGVTWAYWGPGVVQQWTAFTPYNKGDLSQNPVSGQYYRCEVAGTSGAAPGPTFTQAWLANTDYLTVGQVVSNGSLYYKVSLPGHSAVLPATGPSGTGTGIVDGTVIWDYFAPAQTIVRPVWDGTVIWSRRSTTVQSTQQIGFSAASQVGFNAGGTSFRNALGQQWGTVLGGIGVVNATFYSASCAVEIDDNFQGSARQLVGLQIIRQGRQARYSDWGLTVASSFNLIADRYKNAFILQSAADVDQGYAMALEDQRNGLFQHMAGALDMRMVIPDGAAGPFGGGFFIRTPDSQLDPTGWRLRYGGILTSALGMSIDVPNVALQSLVVTDGGVDWSVGTFCKGSDGFYGVAATISGPGPTGPLTSVTVLVPSYVPGPAGTHTIQINPAGADTFFDTSVIDAPPNTIYGTTGAPIWATPAIATATYAAPATPTLNVGTSKAVAINVGNAGSTTTFTGAVVLPSTTTANYLPLAGGVLTGPTTVSFNAAAVTSPVFSTLLQLTTADNTAGGITFDHAGATGVTRIGFRGAGGTIAVPTATPTMQIAQINAGGHDGSAYQNIQASILFNAPGLWTVGSTPMQIIFNATSNASATMAEQMRIHGAGVLIGRTTATVGILLDVNGAFRCGTVGFNGTVPAAKPTITGSRAANAALASLLTALAATGLLTDSSTV